MPINRTNNCIKKYYIVAPRKASSCVNTWLSFSQIHSVTISVFMNREIERAVKSEWRWECFNRLRLIHMWLRHTVAMQIIWTFSIFLRQHTCLPHPHASNTRCVNGPLRRYKRHRMRYERKSVAMLWNIIKREKQVHEERKRRHWSREKRLEREMGFRKKD